MSQIWIELGQCYPNSFMVFNVTFVKIRKNFCILISEVEEREKLLVQIVMNSDMCGARKVTICLCTEDGNAFIVLWQVN